MTIQDKSSTNQPDLSDYSKFTHEDITLYWKAIDHNLVKVVLPQGFSDEFLHELRKVAEDQPSISKAKLTLSKALQLKIQKRCARKFRQFLPTVLTSLANEIIKNDQIVTSPGGIVPEPKQTPQKPRGFVNKPRSSNIPLATQ